LGAKFGAFFAEPFLTINRHHRDSTFDEEPIADPISLLFHLRRETIPSDQFQGGRWVGVAGRVELHDHFGHGYLVTGVANLRRLHDLHEQDAMIHSDCYVRDIAILNDRAGYE
jgi:hypothetical protein